VYAANQEWPIGQQEQDTRFAENDQRHGGLWRVEGIERRSTPDLEETGVRFALETPRSAMVIGKALGAAASGGKGGAVRCSGAPALALLNESATDRESSPAIQMRYSSNQHRSSTARA
jgi:hypothetical protein